MVVDPYVALGLLILNVAILSIQLATISFQKGTIRSQKKIVESQQNLIGTISKENKFLRELNIKMADKIGELNVDLQSRRDGEIHE